MATVQPTLRKDAARSRDAILVAARELFSDGRDVPMYEIGRRAGVGQATLYRHFPDRSSLVAALAREHVDRVEAIAAEHADDDSGLLFVLGAAAEMLVSMHEVIRVVRDEAGLAPVLCELRKRMLTVLHETLRRSRAAEGIHDDVDASDLVLVLNMVNGALAGISSPADRAAAARRALALALDGIRDRA